MEDRVNSKVNSVTCFLCGDEGCAPVTNSLGRRHLYLKQVQCFKTYLSEGRDGDETCANCRQEIQQVWSLNQEIEDIKEDIARIVGKVTARMAREGGIRVEKVIKDGGSTKSRQIQSVEGQGIPKIGPQDLDKFLITSLGDGPDLNAEIEEEIPWSGVEDAFSSTQGCFDDLEIKPEPDDEVLDDIPTQVSQEFVIYPDMRTSKIPAEETIVPETMSEDEYTANEGESEEYSESEVPTEPESDDSESEGPPKKKRKGVKKTKTFPCSFCFKKLSSRVLWARHEANVCKVPGWTPAGLKAEFNITMFPCPKEGCGKLFNRQNELNHHLTVHDRSLSEKYSCPNCHRSYRFEVALAKHVCRPGYKRKPRKRTNILVRPRELCDLCGASVPASRMSLHKRMIHDRIYNHVCPHCQRRFFTAQRKNRHVATVHEGKKDNGQNGLPYICEDCGAQYRYIPALKAHQAKIHAEKGPTHQCSRCPRKWYTRYELINHEKRHEKYEWCCGSCGRNFTSQPELEKHKEKWAGKVCRPLVFRKMTRKEKQEMAKGVEIVDKQVQMTNKFKKKVAKKS